MPTQSEAFRLMLAAISAMREAGYTQEDVAELVGAAGRRPAATRLRPLPQLPSTDHRVVSLPVVHHGPGALPQVRQALVNAEPSAAG